MQPAWLENPWQPGSPPPAPHPRSGNQRSSGIGWGSRGRGLLPSEVSRPPPLGSRLTSVFVWGAGGGRGGGRDDGRGCLTLALNQRDYELRDNTHSFQKAARRGTRVYVGSGAEGHIPPTPIPKIKMNPRSPTSLEPDLSHQKKSSVLIA